MKEKNKRTLSYKEEKMIMAEHFAFHKKPQQYSQAGITLVALVVTIIVLLILAGVTIQLALDNNGIIGRAKDSSTIWANATANEITQMEKYAEDVDELAAGYIGSGGQGGNLGELTGVDFGTKTASTIAQGDTITIGTEQFMVLKNANNRIMAMPYYNITLPEILAPASGGEYPVQSPDAGMTTFSESVFWSEEYSNIEPMSSSNIQKYITAYSEKLKALTNNRATAEVGRHFGDDSLAEYEVMIYLESEGVRPDSSYINPWQTSYKYLLNPGMIEGADYWLGSSLYIRDYPDWKFYPVDYYSTWGSRLCDGNGYSAYENCDYEYIRSSPSCVHYLLVEKYYVYYLFIIIFKWKISISKYKDLIPKTLRWRDIC